MLIPESDIDSIWSIPFTVEVNARSVGVVIIFSMSAGHIPVYVQTQLTIGISIGGKISTAIWDSDTSPKRAIKIAITIKVWGWRNASLTIHTSRDT